MKRPILIVTLGYIIGIIWGLCFKTNIALFALVLWFIVTLLRKTVNYIPEKLISKMNQIMVITIIISAIISNFAIITENSKYENLYKEIEELEGIGTIISSGKIGKYNTTYKLKVESINENLKYKNTQVYIMIKNDNLKFGDKIKFKGEFIEPDEARNYKGFNYKQYLKTLKIYGNIKAKDNIEILGEGNCNVLSKAIHNSLNEIKNKICSVLPEKSANLFVGILLGDTSNMEEDLQEKFMNTGLTHILSVSGLHVNYIILGITVLLERININKKIQRVLIIIFLIVFMVLANFTPSVIRAVIMSNILLISKIIYKQNDVLSSFSFALLILLIINPFYIYNVGFLLSFGGTLGIIIFHKDILDLISQKVAMKNKVIDGLKSITAVSLSAQIIIIPIMIYNFGTFNTIFLISNLLTSHLITVILILGIVNIIIALVSLRLGKMIGIVLNTLIELLVKIVEILGEIPLATVYIINFPIFCYVIYYLAIFLPKYKYEKTISVIKKVFVPICVIVIIITSVFIIIPQDLKIFFIDVGQGDSTLIITSDNKKMLIDGGGNSDLNNFDVGERILVPYLLKRGIKIIDYVMISHFDADHCNGLIAVLENLNVKQVIVSKQNKTKEYENIMKIIKNKKIKVKVIKEGDILQIGKNVQIKILGPEIISKEISTNNSSIVAKLKYNNFSMLFTGDIEGEGEMEMVKKYKQELNSDVLKVAHHGSKTSSQEEFISAISPKIALIGVGKSNTFGHPDTSVLKTLEKYRCKVYRTDEKGEIILTVNKKGNIKIRTML